MSRSKRPPEKQPTVDSNHVKRLAALSCLAFEPKQEQSLQRELSAVLGYFAIIDKVDVTGVPPVYEREGQEAATRGLREDSPIPSFPDAVLAGVPQRKDRYVKAPKVF